MVDLAFPWIGVSAAVRHLEDELQYAARSDAKILVTGESGVGKEVVARMVHRLSTRAQQPFVAVNCAGVPDSLLESELFGHVRGSFTGAYRDKPGLLELAHGGTVFLDEVGEMSLRMQAMLLRFLEDGHIQRLGAEYHTAAVDVRVVTATNRVLLERVADGQFREDLFYRLNVIHLIIPPLRDRREDVVPLLEYYLGHFSAKYGRAVPTTTADALAYLQQYDWPGNIRELKNLAERLVIRSRAEFVTLDDLTASMAASARGVAPGPAAAPVSAARDTGVLFDRVVRHQESFWSAVYEPFMLRDLTRADVRRLITEGLQHTRGNYKMLVELFHIDPRDYKRLLNFLRKHDCHVAFQPFRGLDVPAARDAAEPESEAV